MIAHVRRRNCCRPWPGKKPRSRRTARAGENSAAMPLKMLSEQIDWQEENDGLPGREVYS